MTSWRIVCDVGGTNIRYARSDASRRLSHLVVAPSESCVSLEETLLAFAHGFDDHDDLAGIAVAAAGPLEDGAVQLTNLGLSISANAIRRTFDGRSARVLNDLEAVAWSLPYLSDADLSSICVAARALSGPRLVVNVGTGFGAAVLVPTPGGWHSIPCEPGHMKLASGLGCLAGELLATTSIEGAISGRALRDRLQFNERWGCNYFDVMSDRTSDQFADMSATDEACVFVSNYSAIFGQVCGDLVLACGAWGGVYLCGSVASAWCKQADKAAFCAAFIEKGPMAGRMSRVSVDEIIAPDPALIGLSEILLD